MASWRRATSNIASQIVSLAAGVFDRIVLVGLLLRMWGADAFGAYSVVQSWAGLLLMFEFGAQIYFQNEEQKAFVRGDHAAFRRVAATHQGLSLALVIPLALAFTALVASGGTDHAVRLPGFDITSARWMLWALGMGNLLSVLRAPASTVFAATGDFAYVTLVSAASTFLNSFAAFVAVGLGASPLIVAGLFLAIYGVGGFLAFHFDVRARRPEWTAPPAWPSGAEFLDAFNHVKWFALHMIAPTVWLQAPILVFAARGVRGSEIAAFLLVRTMVNQIRQTFQFASVGAGLEIATFSHAGDFARAWAITAEVGRVTTVIAAAFVAGIFAFGPTVTYYWAGDARLYDVRVAAAMLLPLLAIAPMQQPMALLQLTNRSFEVGMLRLGLVVLGPLGCVVGEALGGAPGLATGLGLAELAAYGALVPRLARLPQFPGFVGYLARSLALGVGATGLCLAAALALQAWMQPAGLLAFLAEVALWGALVVLPLIFVALPHRLRRAAGARLAPAFRETPR